MSNITSPIDNALRQFEATEANLEKLERVFREIQDLIPKGIQFGINHKYDEQCRIFKDILKALPKIDGWKPECHFWDLNEIAQNRLDAAEISEPLATLYMDESILEPIRQLKEYRYKLNRKRKQLIRRALTECMANIDELLRKLFKKHEESTAPKTKVEFKIISQILTRVIEIDTLLGNSTDRPSRWSDLRKHLYSTTVSDLHEIINTDWPNVNSWLSSILFDRNEPVTVEVEDIGELAKTEPEGTIVTSLKWDRVSPENFERLLFALISNAPEYENPEWLMDTNASDRGRDLSAVRVFSDSLSGVKRSRIIIQCKHWLKKSISSTEISKLREQMQLWEPPRVDILVIATTGRFSADAVSTIEKNNSNDRALHIEMWPGSHLELLLTRRPALIAEFQLK